MSSMLTVRHGAADPSSSHYPSGSYHCREASWGMLLRRDYEGTGHFRGGLPTPPGTADMTANSTLNGKTAATHNYSYPPTQPSSSSIQHGSQQHEQISYGSTIEEHYDPRRDPHPHRRPSTTNVKQEESIASYLQIPESVNASKGSITEFAAEITCLFWFETSPTLEYAEKLPEGSIPDRSLNPDAVPTIGFRKWVTTILSTTAVGKNVILLALMFIYRLKKFNPSVSGKRGSEFRLLTIALMLGNKFLDDNTYTNKTWAEVSGISVNEIHIMEVEFLSNMRYELYASQAQWQEWKSRLNRFASFYEMASKLDVSPKAISPSTPITQVSPHKMPSPPSGSRLNGHYVALPNPLHTLPHLPRSPAKQYTPSEYPFDRKRSLDTSLDLPPAKRIQSSFPATNTLSPAVYTPQSAYTPDSAISYDLARLPQLPVPNLPNPANLNSSHLTPLSLPGPRAMSTVYPTTSAYPQSGTPVAVAPPNQGHIPNPMGAANNVSRVPSHSGSAHTSPTNLYGLSTPTRPGLSPSYFLMNRSSPYRPVRNVNTLLYPPPSAAMQNPIKSIDFQQMQYQPLSKNTSQLHPGPMPSLHPDAWQGYASTPISQAYRPY